MDEAIESYYDGYIEHGQINTRISCGRDSVIRSCLMDVDL